MRPFLRLIALFVSVAVAAPVASRPAQAQDAPRPKLNFVFILIDDMGWKDAGCNGSTFYQTPNIDRLAAQGMLRGLPGLLADTGQHPDRKVSRSTSPDGLAAGPGRPPVAKAAAAQIPAISSA